MFFQRYLLNYLVLKDVAVLIDLFKHKNVKLGSIYHCYNAVTTESMQKIFNENYVRVCSKRLDLNLLDINSIKLFGYDKVGVVLDASCDGWVNAINSKDMDDVLLKKSLVWFVVTDSLTETIDVLSLFKINIESDVTIISKLEEKYILYEIYHTGFNSNGQLIVREIGHWKESLNVEVKDRRDLKGLVLKATVVIPQTQRVVNRTFLKYLEEEEPNFRNVDPMHKFKGYTALIYLRDMLNITYEFQRSRSWGYPTNGTFDGLVGALQRCESDIGGSPLFIRADRLDAVDYVAETWLTKPSFIFRHPKHPGGYFTIYTRPLTTEVWYSVILIMTFAGLLLGVLLNLKIIKLAGDIEDGSPSLVLLLICSAFCQQGMSVSRSSNSVKIVLFTIFLFALTIYQYYNATVVSTLLREQPKNIKTLSDLSKSRLGVGIEYTLYNKDYFERTTDPIAREIYLKKVVNSKLYNYFSAEQGMAMVKNGSFAFHLDSAVAYRIIRRTFSERELCELQEVNVFGSYLGLAVAKGSPYKEILAYGIRKLKESGLMSRLSSQWDEPRPACVRTPDSSMISVSLLEFSTALAALAVGYVAALLVLAGEMLAAKLARRPKPLPAIRGAKFANSKIKRKKDFVSKI